MTTGGGSIRNVRSIKAVSFSGDSGKNGLKSKEIMEPDRLSGIREVGHAIKGKFGKAGVFLASSVLAFSLAACSGESHGAADAGTPVDYNCTLQWARRAGGVDNDSGAMNTILPEGGAVLTGYITGEASFDDGESNETIVDPGLGTAGAFLAKYDEAGKLAWVKHTVSAGDEYGTLNNRGVGEAVARLSDGSLVLAGHFRGPVIFGEGEATEETVVSSIPPDQEDYSSDLFIAKYNPDGSFAWIKTSSGGSSEGARSIAVLEDDSLLITGMLDETAVFGEGEPNETTLVPADADGSTLNSVTSDMLLAKYDPDGNLVWAKRAGGPNDEQGSDVVALQDGSSIVLGTFGGSAVFGEGEPAETTLESESENEFFIAKYNPDGTLAWAKATGAGGLATTGEGIAALQDGSSVVTGRFEGTAVFGKGEPNETTLVSENKDLFVAKYNPDGTLAWVKASAGEGASSGTAVAVLADGSILVTGYAGRKHTTVFGKGEANETTVTGGQLHSEAIVAKYASDGTFLWVDKTSGGSGGDHINAAQELPDGSIMLAGHFVGDVIFWEGQENATTLISEGQDEAFIAKITCE